MEHAAGIYIELLLLACLVGVLTNYLTHIPYTVALTIVGLIIAALRIGPDIQETGFSKELILFVMLPPLLFQGALHMNLNKLLEHIRPIAAYAIIGVLISTFVIGGMMHWIGGLGSFLIALLFGALISPTDPVSVLAIFKEAKVPDDLRYLVEGESLFNDGVGIVVFTIILNMVLGEGGFGIGHASFEFVKVAFGGLILGTILGIVTFWLMARFHDPLLETALCVVLAWGSFWLAEKIHVSGVIATVMAGLMIGNYGRRLSMDTKTTETIESFFETIDFLINSLLFILIGLELREISMVDVQANGKLIVVALIAFLVARAVVVYPIYGLFNLAGTKRPGAWSHILFWGGLRGSIPIALLLGIPHSEAIEPYRPALLVCGFAVVLFSLVGQGLTMKPLIRKLNLSVTEEQH